MGSTLSVSTLQGLTSGVNANQVVVPTGHKIIGTDTASVYSPGGILQIQSTTVRTITTVSGVSDPAGAGANLGLSVSITPKASGSYFYITCNIGVGSATSGNTWAIGLFRDSTKLSGASGDPYTSDGSHASGVWFKSIDHAGNNGTDTNHGVGASGSYLDTTGSTAGTSITFEARGFAEEGVIRINAVESDYTGVGSGPVSSRAISTITIMEIAQ